MKIFVFNFRRYLDEIVNRVTEVQQFYPGWTVRIYYDLSEERDLNAFKTLCQIWCQHRHVDMCDVTNLPRPFGDLKSWQPIGMLFCNEF